jgi:hypothetical protein
MRILTTSDLCYVTGGNAQDTVTGSFVSNPEGGSSGTGYTQQEVQQNIDGILMAVDNPFGYSLGILRSLYQCYKNSSSFRGMSVGQIAAAIASGCADGN